MNAAPLFPVQDTLRVYGRPAHAVLMLPTVEGLSARALVDRLPDSLLVTVEVDDPHVITVEDAAAWTHTCAELYADLRPVRKRTLLNRYDRGVFQLVVRPPGGGAPPAWCMKSLGFPVPGGTKVAAVSRESGYIAQFYLPEPSFREIHGPFRDRLFLDIAVHRMNRDGARISAFWRGNENNWQYPHGFGEMVLSKRTG